MSAECGRKTELGRSHMQLSGEEREEEELTQLLQSMGFASGDGRKKVRRLQRQNIAQDLTTLGTELYL